MKIAEKITPTKVDWQKNIIEDQFRKVIRVKILLASFTILTLMYGT